MSLSQQLVMVPVLISCFTVSQLRGLMYGHCELKVILLHNVLLTFTVFSYACLMRLGTCTPILNELFGLLQQVTNQVCLQLKTVHKYMEV